MDKNFLNDFPILRSEMNGHPLAYLDNGATTQKPHSVVREICGYYGGCNANPHRGVYELSVKATKVYEDARRKVAQFLNAKSTREIIFTKNATESLNLIAYSYGLNNLRGGDEILITIAEHHSNLVPWQRVAQVTGAKLNYIYLAADGNLSAEDIDKKLSKHTKILAVTQISNVLGLVNDVKKLAARAHEVGAVIVVDGAQSVPHIPVDVQDLDADFLAFSGHKMLSPMGIGVLYGKKKILEEMPPFLSGGDMIEYVEEQATTFAELPQKFEAGTQNVGGAAGLSAAIDYLQGVGFAEIERIERDLTNYTIAELKKIPYVELYGCDAENKIGLVTFNVKDVHPHDVATILDAQGVAIRAGHHCAQPLMKFLGQNSTCRASFYFYNTRRDVERLIEAVQKVRGVMRLA
ncbi:MAG: cysteine desulfurase [Quinella sp. 3Q1]|nr:cysteine desulfurase [Quinella sp. 3Q1]MBR6887380.1 cysteine desulfurase [Selenomonadaceae bacterium]